MITDEIPQDFDHAPGVYEDLEINTVEPCVVGGTNVVSHDEAGLARIVAAVEDRGVRVGAFASLSSSARSTATASREAAHSAALKLLGNLFHSQVFGEGMVSAGDGSIVNVPMMAAGPLTSVVGYSATKADVENLTRWLAVELARRATARGCGSTP